MGYLHIKEEFPSSQLATPFKLQYPFLRAYTHVITNAAQGMRQVRAPEVLADVLTNSSTSYVVRLFSPTNIISISGGLYQLTNSPHTTVTVEHPVEGGGANTNKLKITQTRDGNDTIGDYAWITNGWELVTGNGLRKETRTFAWFETNTLKTITNLIQEGASAPVFRKVEKHRVYSYGERLIEEVTGSSNYPLTNSYVWTTNGYLQQAVRSDGSWEYNLYDSQNRATNVFSGFLNQAVTTDKNLCRLLEHSYDTNTVSGSGDNGVMDANTPRQTVEYLLGSEIGRSYFVAVGDERRKIRCATPGAAWNASDNLTNITRVYTNGFHHHEPWITKRPDGTADIFLYNAITTNGTTNLVLSGHLDGSGTNVDQGTKTVTIFNKNAYVLSRTSTDIESSITIVSETYQYDSLSRLTNTTYLDGMSIQTFYDCCGPSSTTDRDGTVTSYTYDALKRLLTTTRNSITVSNIYDAAGNVLSVVRFGGGTAITTRQATYDDAGRLTSSTDALNNTTTITNLVDGNGQWVKTNTLPDTGTRIETAFADGSVKSLTGTGAHPMQYNYGVESESGTNRFFVLEIRLDAAGGTNEWTKTYRDMLGRNYKTVYSAASGTPANQSFYNSNGQLSKTVDADGVTTFFQYNAKGEPLDTIVDVANLGTIDFNGTDRVTRTVTDFYTNDATVAVRRTRTYVWGTHNSDTSNLVATVEVAADGLKTWDLAHNGAATITSRIDVRYDTANGLQVTTNTAPDGSYAVSTNQNGRLASVTRRDSTGAQIGQMTYGYDTHGRPSILTDARTGATTNYFNNADQVSGTATPAPAAGQSAQVTTNYFDSMGRVWKTVLPDGGSVTNEFFLTGELKKTSGSRTYPAGYSYDAQGRLKSMTNWTSLASQAGATTTTWNYDPYRGFLTNKVHADSKGPSYTYTAGGRLQGRTWARGVTATNAYNNAGELAVIGYSDATPTVSYGYERRGRPGSITNGAQVCSLAWNDQGQLLREGYTGGPLDGLSVTNSYDGLLRRTTNALGGTSYASPTSYSYDNASRLSTVGDGTNVATYGYLTNSPLAESITFRQSGTVRMTTTNRYDNLNRRTAVLSVPSASAAANFNYAYNSANQRTAVTNTDNSKWTYQYDSLGQLTYGKKFWSDATIVAGQQYEYTFDDIGNRVTTKNGGDTSGNNLRTASYTNNNLNQITGRAVPGYVNVIGAANSNATVTVNRPPTGNAAPLRKGEYYWTELAVTNATNVAYMPLTNIAVLNNGTNADIVATNKGNFLLAKNPETFAYDLDGNLLRDGLWTNVWDGENRLLSQTNLTGVPSAARKKLDFTYDYFGRRIQKIVSIWTNSAYVAQSTNRFVYDGWNLIAEVNHTNALIRSYAWGLDLSGTMQGAGGVGGLLVVTQPTGSTNFVACDGNGNVTTLINAADGSATAEYEYGPFGEAIRVTGIMGKANPIRFSTKYQDEETGFLYYGYRYERDGRWLSRDPLGEEGGLNLYGFLGNDPVRFTDRGGRDNWSNPTAGQNAPPVNVFSPAKQLNSDGAAAQLLSHFVSGGGAPFIRRGGEWGEFVSNHPEVRSGLQNDQITFAIKALRECEASGKSRGNYFLRNPTIRIAERWRLALTLNLGTVIQTGQYEVRCCQEVIFRPRDTVYLDEVTWKIPGWVPPEYDTHLFPDLFPGAFMTAAGAPISLFQQFYFEVSWNSPSVVVRRGPGGGFTVTPND